jgi:hypothetical protein
MLKYQNCWVYGPRPSSAILNTRKHDVSESGSVIVLKWRGDTYSVGSLITRLMIEETDSVSGTEFWTDKVHKSNNSV